MPYLGPKKTANSQPGGCSIAVLERASGCPLRGCLRPADAQQQIIDFGETVGIVRQCAARSLAGKLGAQTVVLFLKELDVHGRQFCAFSGFQLERNQVLNPRQPELVVEDLQVGLYGSRAHEVDARKQRTKM